MIKKLYEVLDILDKISEDDARDVDLLALEAHNLIASILDQIEPANETAIYDKSEDITVLYLSGNVL